MTIFQQKQYEEMKKKKDSGQFAAPTAPVKMSESAKKASASTIQKATGNVQSQSGDPLRKDIMRTKSSAGSSQTRWYKGASPTEVETLAQIYSTSQQDEAKARYQYGLYEQAKQEGHWAETYDKATSQYLTALGLTADQVNDELFIQAAPYMNAGIITNAGNQSTAKKNSTAANFAGLYDDYQKTKVLQAEEAEAAKEAQYWIAKGLTDEEIIQKLNIGGEGSKYSNLTKAFNKTKTGEYEPTTAPIQLLTSYGVQGMLYGLRNPNDASGDYKMDAVKAAMGRGVQVSATPDEIARRTPGSGSWAPYSNGTTMDDEAIRFGVGKEFSTDWLEKNRDAVFASGDQKAISDFGKVYAAEEFTKEAEAEYADLIDNLNRTLSAGGDLDADEIIKKLFYIAGENKYPSLAELDESLLSGKIIDTTRGIGYDRKSIEQTIRDHVAAQNALVQATTDPATMEKVVQAEKQAATEENGGTLFTTGALSDAVDESVRKSILFDGNISPDAIREGFAWLGNQLSEYSQNRRNRRKEKIEQEKQQKEEETQKKLDMSEQLIGEPDESSALPEPVAVIASEGASDVSSKARTMTAEEYDSAQAEVIALESEGRYEEAAKKQFPLLVAAVTNSDDEYVKEIVTSVGSQEAALYLTRLIFEGDMLNQLDDDTVWDAVTNYEYYICKVLDIDTASADMFAQVMDFISGDAYSETRDNTGVGFLRAAESTLVQGGAKANDWWATIAGAAMTGYGHAVKGTNWLVNNTLGKLFGFQLNDTAAEATIEAGQNLDTYYEKISAREDAFMRENATPFEYYAASAGSEAIKMGVQSVAGSAITGKVTQGATSLISGKTTPGATSVSQIMRTKDGYRQLQTAMDLAKLEGFTSHIAAATPFIADSAASEYNATYQETENPVTALVSGLVSGFATASLMNVDAIKNIESMGKFVPDVIDTLTAMPGSGLLAAGKRYGKAGMMYLGNMFKTAANEMIQEPTENFLTTWVTDTLKGKGFFTDRDWGEYASELASDAFYAAIGSFGNTMAAMPSWSRSAIYANRMMGKTGLTPAEVTGQLNAFIEDMNDPQVSSQVNANLEAIAVEARTGELLSEGAMPDVDSSAVVAAEKAVQEKTEVATQATAEKDAAYAQFRENPADDAATSRLSAAVKQEQKAVKDAQDAQAELSEAQASVQAQREAAMEATRAQAESEVQGSLRANVENRLARESVSGYNEPAGGVTNGEANRGYDGRGSSGSDAEGRGGNPKRNGMVRRTAVESKTTDTSGGTLAGTISRGKSGYESFKRATSKGPVGENGEPLILYHGTGEDFEMIERRDGRNYDTSHGIYLTTSPSVANEYAFRSSNTGEQYIHPVAINSQKIVYFDGDSFFQDPDYQNYVAKRIEQYNRYADKEGFAEKLDIALAHEVNDGNISEDIAQSIREAFAMHGKIDVVGVLGTDWNFGMDEIDDQYIVFDPSLLVPATEAYWAEQEQEDTDSSSGGGNSDGISRTQVPPQTVQTGTQRGTPLTNPIESSRKLAGALHIGERIGTRKMNNLPQAVLGYYANRARYLAVRPNQASNITVAFHEIGHALSQQLNLTGTPAMIANLNPAFAQNYPANQLPGEAFAEFVWRYMVDDQQAEAFAGAGFVRQFEQALRANDLADAVHTARDEMHAYVNATSLERIRSMVRDRSYKPKMGIREKLTQLLSGLVDSTKPLEDVNRFVREQSNGQLAAEDNLQNSALLRNTASKRAWNMLTGNRTDANWTVVGDSLASVIEATGMNGRDFDLLSSFMLAQHSLDRDAQGLPVFDASLTSAQRNQLIADVQRNHPEVARAAQAIHDWWHDFMQTMMVDTGYLTQEALDTFERMYPHYVPTNRVKKQGVRRGTGSGRTYTVMRATGSTEEIYNPIDSLVQNVNSIVEMVSQNNTALTFDRLYRQYDGLGIFGREVTQDMERDHVNVTNLRDQISDILTNANTDVDVMDQVLDLIGTEQEEWRGTGRVNLPNILTVQRPDGTRGFYEISDNELFKALANTKDGGGAVLDFVGRFTRAMSALTTGSNPLFSIRNFARDFQKSVNYGSWASNYGTGIAKWLSAAYDVWREQGDFVQYKALGGGGWTRIDTGTKKGATEYRGELFKGYNTSNVGRTAKWAGKKLWNTITLSRFNEIVEQTSKYVEYKYGRNDKSTPEGRQQAFLESQESSVDFSRSGNSSFASGLKQVIPFFNASVQGVYQTAREYTSEQERGRLPARFAKTVVNTMISSALASAALLKFMDDDDKEEFFWLSDDLKAEHIYLPNFAPEILGEAPLIRIPLAQDPLSYAVHNFTTNAIWRGQGDGPVVEAASIADTILSGLNPISGTVFDAAIATATNRNWYGSRIVPQRMEQWEPTTQYTEETADVFVDAGRVLGMSPMMLEYLAEQYTGFLGQIVIPAISKDANTGEMQGISATVAEARKKLTSDPLISNDVVNAFYDGSTFLTQVKNAAQNDKPANMLRRGLSEQEVAEAAAEAKAMVSSKGIIGVTKKFITEGYNRIDAIEADTALSDKEKYQLTSQIRREMIEAALDANEAIGEYREKYVDGMSLLNRFIEGTYAQEAK